MPRFTITSDQTGVGAGVAEATGGDPGAYVLEMPRGSAAVAVAVPAVAACFASVLAVLALVHLSLGGFVIGGLVAAGAGLAARQGLRATSVPQVAAGPGGLYLSGLGMGPGARRAQVVPWSEVRRLVVCCALEPSGRAVYGPTRRPALAVEGTDLAARLEGRIDAPTAGPVRRLPYQALARPLEGADRDRLAAAVRRYAPQVQLVDGPDIDTRETTVYVGRPTG